MGDDLAGKLWYGGGNVMVWRIDGQLSKKRKIFSSHSEGSIALIHWRHDEQDEPHHVSLFGASRRKARNSAS